MKLFKTSNTEIVNQCRHFFGIELPSVQLVKRFEKFSCNVSLLVDCVKQLYVCYFLYILCISLSFRLSVWCLSIYVVVRLFVDLLPEMFELTAEIADMQLVWDDNVITMLWLGLEMTFMLVVGYAVRWLLIHQHQMWLVTSAAFYWPLYFANCPMEFCKKFCDRLWYLVINVSQCHGSEQ